MPNATVRANAQTMPEAANRRAVLAAVLAAGAASVLPAVAAARSHHPDADLFTLIELARTADSVADEACRAADDVLHKIAPSFPQALIWAETDDPFWYGVRPGERIPARDIDFLRAWLKLPERPDRPQPPDYLGSPLIPLRASPKGREKSSEPRMNSKHFGRPPGNIRTCSRRMRDTKLSRSDGANWQCALRRLQRKPWRAWSPSSP